MPDLVIALFAKPPVPGRVKTRLAVHIGAERAAALAAAMLRDAWTAASGVPGAAVVLATPAPEDDRDGLGDVPRWHQGGGDLGARMVRVLARGLLEAPRAVAVGADVVGLTPARFALLLDAWGAAPSVLAPVSDGGYWAFGLATTPPEGLLDGVRWSAATTLAESRERLAVLGPVALGPAGEDVDEVSDLRHLLGTGGHAEALARAWGLLPPRDAPS